MHTSGLNAPGPLAPALRPIAPGDQEFLRHLYLQVHQHELVAAELEPAQRDALLTLQFNAQRRRYEIEFPDAQHSVILLEQLPAGQLRIARSPDKPELIDISVLPRFQHLGIGSSVIRMLQIEAVAAVLPIHLTVLRSSPALRLYRRLGFTVSQATDVHYAMHWLPAEAEVNPGAGG
jgi:ribosomal protein S18 acetylase RimI-like enzyme